MPRGWLVSRVGYADLVTITCRAACGVVERSTHELFTGEFHPVRAAAHTALQMVVSLRSGAVLCGVHALASNSYPRATR